MDECGCGRARAGRRVQADGHAAHQGHSRACSRHAAHQGMQHVRACSASGHAARQGMQRIRACSTSGHEARQGMQRIRACSASGHAAHQGHIRACGRGLPALNTSPLVFSPLPRDTSSSDLTPVHTSVIRQPSICHPWVDHWPSMGHAISHASVIHGSCNQPSIPGLPLGPAATPGLPAPAPVDLAPHACSLRPPPQLLTSAPFLLSTLRVAYGCLPPANACNPQAPTDLFGYDAPSPRELASVRQASERFLGMRR